MKSFAVVFTYSFDDDAAVYLFDTQDEAVDFLKQSILEEYRIDTEENGWDSWYKVADSGLSGELITYFPDHEDHMWVHVGNVYQRKG